MKNSLEESVEKYELILAEIKTKEEIIKSEKLGMNKLADEKSRLKTSIFERQLKGKKIQNPLIDYCFRNFRENVYESLELLNEFVSQIKEYSGQKILVAREKEKLEIGIISGECEFEVNKSFRNLYVPVSNSKKLEINAGEIDWEKGENKIWINDDIFDPKNIKFEEMNPQKSKFFKKFPKILKEQIEKYKKSKEFGKFWFVDYSKEIYFGGPGPNNWSVYMGNKIVKHNLKKFLEIKIPIGKITLPSPEDEYLFKSNLA